MYLKKIKKAIFYVIFYSGFVYILRSIIYRIYSNPICIFFMHRIVDDSQDLYPFLLRLGHLDRKDFERKISYLAKRYRIISMQECLEYIKTNSRPRYCVVLTFDDGHRDLYRNAYPILKEKKIPATIFLTTKFIDNEEMTWFDKVDYLILKTEVTEFQIPDLSDRIYSILSNDDKIDVAFDIEEKLKEFDSSKRNSIIESMAEILKIDISKCKHENSMLSWKEIMEMNDSGLIVFGSHGVSHPILTNEREEYIEYEIAMSKQIIEQKLGKTVFSFAYPNGDFNEFMKSKLKENGYLCGLSCIPKIANEETDWMELGRIGFFDGTIYELGVKMACFPWLSERILRKLSRRNY